MDASPFNFGRYVLLLPSYPSLVSQLKPLGQDWVGAGGRMGNRIIQVFQKALQQYPDFCNGIEQGCARLFSFFLSCSKNKAIKSLVVLPTTAGELQVYIDEYSWRNRKQSLDIGMVCSQHQHQHQGLPKFGRGLL